MSFVTSISFLRGGGGERILYDPILYQNIVVRAWDFSLEFHNLLDFWWIRMGDYARTEGLTVILPCCNGTVKEKQPKKKTKSGNQINKHKAKEGRHSCYLPSARFVDGKLRPRSWVGPSIKNAYLANQIRRWGMQPAQRCFGKNKVALSQIWLLCCFTLKKTLSSDSKRTAFDSIDHRDCSNRKFSLKRSHLRHDSVKIFKVTTLSKQRKDTLVLIFSSFGFIYSENSFGSAVVAKRHVPTSLPLLRRSRFPFPCVHDHGTYNIPRCYICLASLLYRCFRKAGFEW